MKTVRLGKNKKNKIIHLPLKFLSVIQKFNGQKFLDDAILAPSRKSANTSFNIQLLLLLLILLLLVLLLLLLLLLQFILLLPAVLYLKWNLYFACS